MKPISRKLVFQVVSAFMLVILMVPMVSACSALPFGKPAGTPTVTLTPAPTMPTEPLTPDQILSHGIERTNMLGSYRATYVMSMEVSELGIFYKVSAAVSARNNPYSSYEKVIEENNDGKRNYENQIVGTKEYTREGESAPWTLLPTPEAPVQEPENELDWLKQAANVTLVGEEKLNGAVECYHLQFELDSSLFGLTESGFELPPASTNDLWVGKKDLLVRRWSFEVPAIIQGYAAPFKGTFDFYGFDQSVTIPTPFLKVEMP